MRVKVTRLNGEEAHIDADDSWTILDLAKAGIVCQEPFWNQSYSMGQEILSNSARLADLLQGKDALHLTLTVLSTPCLVTSGSDEDPNFSLWSLLNGDLLGRIVSDDAQSSMCLDLSKDGRHVLVGKKDCSACIYSFEKGQKVQTFHGCACKPTASLSADGSKLLVRAGNRVELWSPAGDKMTSFEGHTAPVISVEFSQDEKSVLTVSQDGAARIFAVRQPAESIEIRHELGSIGSAHFLADGTIQGNTSDGCAVVWDAGSGKVLSTIAPATKGKGKGKGKTRHGSPLPCISPQGPKHVVTALQGDFVLCNASGDILFDFGIRSSHVFGVSPNGCHAWFRNADNDHLELWSMPKETISDGPLSCCSSSSPGLSICKKIWSCASQVDADRMIFSPDSSLVFYLPYFGDDEGLLNPLWDVKAGTHRDVKFSEPPRGLAVISHDNKRLLSANNGKVGVWDLSTGCKEAEWDSQGQEIEDLSSPASADRFVVTMEDRSARIFNMAAETLHFLTLPGPTGHAMPLFSVSFSPDEQIVLTSSYDSVVKLWDVSSGECLQNFRPCAEDFSPFIDAGLPRAFGAFLEGASKIVTLSASDSENDQLGSVTLWASDGSAVKSISGDGRRHDTCFAISSDSKRLIIRKIMHGGKGESSRCYFELLDLESGQWLRAIDNPTELFGAKRTIGKFRHSLPCTFMGNVIGQAVKDKNDGSKGGKGSGSGGVDTSRGQTLVSAGGQWALFSGTYTYSLRDAAGFDGLLVSSDGKMSYELKIPEVNCGPSLFYHVHDAMFSQDESYVYIRPGAGSVLAVFSTATGQMLFCNPDGHQIIDVAFSAKVSE